MALSLCTQLTELNLAYNALEEIDESVGKLIQLEKLILTKNKIKR
jgi:Leucine-rich repeat (LRR) protein